MTIYDDLLKKRDGRSISCMLLLLNSEKKSLLRLSVTYRGCDSDDHTINGGKTDVPVRPHPPPRTRKGSNTNLCALGYKK